MGTLMQEYKYLKKNYAVESQRLFFADLLNKMKEEKKKMLYTGAGPLFSFFDSYFISFFPKKYNRFRRYNSIFQETTFSKFDDIR